MESKQVRYDEKEAELLKATKKHRETAAKLACELEHYAQKIRNGVEECDFEYLQEVIRDLRLTTKEYYEELSEDADNAHELHQELQDIENEA